MGFTHPNSKRSKVRMNSNKTLDFGDKILTIQSLKIHVIHTKSILKVVSIPKIRVPYLWLAWLDLLSFFFFFLFSSLLFPLSLYGFFSPLTNETKLVFKFPCKLRPCLAIKNPFLGSLHNCILSSNFPLFQCGLNSCYFYFGL